MNLLNNPFYILNANTRDNRHKIMDLAEERSLFLDSKQCSQARNDLMNPIKRLSAEVAWLPGLKPKRVSDILKVVKKLQLKDIEDEQVTSIARTNIISEAFSGLNSNNPEEVAMWIVELAWAFKDVDANNLFKIINEERVASGFPKIRSVLLVEEQIQQRRKHYQNISKEVIDKMSPRDLVKAITIAVEEATENGEEQGPILIDDIVVFYEAAAQDFLDKERRNIEVLVKKLITAADQDKNDKVLTTIADRLIDVVKNWDMVAQPIQVSTKSQGLDHDESNYIAEIVRSAAIHLFNEHGKLDLSQKLTKMLKDVFAEVVVVAERTDEDIAALDDFSEKRDQYLKDAEIHAEKWRKEVTYEAEIGIFSKEKLRISPDGVEWKGHVWELDSITIVRWGATKNSVNTTYHIIIGNNSDITEIDTMREDIFSNFIERLWKAVCVRLLTELLEGLAEGNRYQFGSAEIDDKGIVLEKERWVGEGEHIFCPWDELAIWNGPGVFCIGKENDKKLSTKFSYQNDDNIHILEAAIKMLWKRGGDNLSSLLQGQ